MKSHLREFILNNNYSVEAAETAGRSTETLNLVGFVVKVVVVGQFFPTLNWSVCTNNNVLLLLDSYDLRRAIGVARVV